MIWPNEHLDELKDKLIFWGQIWRSCGRPTFGLIHSIKSSVKLNYKLAIRKAFIDQEIVLLMNFANIFKQELFSILANLVKKSKM